MIFIVSSTNNPPTSLALRRSSPIESMGTSRSSCSQLPKRQGCLASASSTQHSVRLKHNPYMRSTTSSSYPSRAGVELEECCCKPQRTAQDRTARREWISQQQEPTIKRNNSMSPWAGFAMKCSSPIAATWASNQRRDPQPPQRYQPAPNWALQGTLIRRIASATPSGRP